MVINQTSQPVDDVRIQATQLLYKNLSDADTDTKLVGWQKQLDIGTCRARLSLGLEERFPVGDHERILYDLWILTRFETFRESIKLQKKSPQQYSEELKLYRGADQKPILERSNVLPIAQ